MTVVVISSERGSAGEYNAKKVAKRLGSHFIDKIVVEATLREYGLTTFQDFYSQPPESRDGSIVTLHQ